MKRESSAQEDIPICPFLIQNTMTTLLASHWITLVELELGVAFGASVLHRAGDVFEGVRSRHGIRALGVCAAGRHVRFRDRTGEARFCRCLSGASVTYVWWKGRKKSHERKVEEKSVGGERRRAKRVQAPPGSLISGARCIIQPYHTFAIPDD